MAIINVHNGNDQKARPLEGTLEALRPFPKSSAILVVGLAIIALGGFGLFEWAAPLTSGSARDNRVDHSGKTMTITGDRSAGAFIAMPDSLTAAPDHILTSMTLEPSEKLRLRQGLRDGAIRIAAVTLWDTMDEDGDIVEISAAGFQQQLTILHAPKIFFVPIYPGSDVRIRAVHDGGGGGVTLGVKTILGDLSLPSMTVGDVIEVPAL